VGTDIHLYVEKQNKNGNWEWVKPPFKKTYEYQDGGSEFYYAYNDWWNRDNGGGNEPDPTSRNYEVFGFLADVRNGYGFAGCPIFNPVEPQFAGRGIPEDIPFDMDGNSTDPNVEMWLGYHDFTWATLSELREAPWNLPFGQVGVIGEEDYGSFKELGHPPGSWSGDIGGKNIVVLTENEYNRYMAGELQLKANAQVYIRVRWGDQPLLHSGFYHWLTCDWMEEIVSSVDDDPDRVRITMGFDS
jgi:hypothetical protein